MKSKYKLPAAILMMLAVLWVGHLISSSKNKVDTSATSNIPKNKHEGSHTSCNHGLLSSCDPETLAQNESRTKKRLFTEIPVNQNSTKLIESVDNDSDWKGQVGGAIRARQITIAPEFRNKKPFQKGEILTLNLFDDVSLDTVVYESLSNVNGTMSTTARVANTTFGRAVMAYTDNELRIKVILPESNKIYEIHYNHDDGNHYVLELDPTLVDKDECGTVAGSKYVDPPKAESDVTGNAQEVSNPPLAEGDEGVALVVIDAMVVYPENVVISGGSEANVQNIAAQGIALANDAHITTNTGMYINLVHTARLSGYTDTGNQSTDLNRVTNLSDGFIDAVHTWRNAYGADFVHMMHSIGGGLGWMPNFATTDPSRPDLGFSVTGWSSFASYTPAHEMGHNMNLSHSKYQATNAGAPTAPTGTDAAGWHWHPGGDTAVTGNCSVMSYTDYTGEAGHTKTGLFSDPNIVHNGQPAGDITDANAARVLRLYKNIYAGYRTRPLAANSILVESPNGGEVLSRGETVQIRWNSNTVVGNIKIDLYKGGTFEREITAGTINDRIYYYTIPNDLPSSSLYKLRISSVNNTSISDYSDVNFTITQSIYATNLDTNPGFTITGGGWAYGAPGGDNPTYGGSSAAYTGTNIYDTNLIGVSSATNYLTTAAIDCSNFQGVNLKFAGWFSVTSGYQANVEVSNNGTTWTQLSSVSAISVSAWSQYSYDISAVADGQSTVYVRWVHLKGAGGGNYSGMSVDDVSITGVILATDPQIATSLSELAPTTLAGSSPANQTFTVTNAGVGTLNYAISDNQSWLAVSPSSGTSTGEYDTITVSYSTSGLSSGTYPATITISDNAAGNSPVTIAVSLSVTASSTYVVSYNGNGNTGGTKPTSQTKNAGVNLTLATNSGGLVKTGYAFAGWNTTANGSGTNYATGASYTANAAVTLYAKWTPNKYTVSYNSNTSTSGTAPSIQTKTYGVNLTLRTNSGNLAKTGYTFAGWNTAANGSGANYATGANYTANVAITLYAKWTRATTYKVSYNSNTSTSGTVPSSQTKTYGVSLTLATNSGSLVKTGYTFAGWNTAANGSGTTYAVGTSYTANAALTLYAKWKRKTYKVRYYSNTSTSGTVPSNQTKTYGVSLTLRTNSGKLVKTGYRFVGWNTAANGSGTTYAAGGAYSKNAALTLYPKWKRKTYKVIYYSNTSTSGTVPSNQNKAYGVSLTLRTNSGKLAKTGYRFVGWNTAANGSGITYASGGAYSKNAALTLYAKWRINDAMAISEASLISSDISLTPTASDGSAPPDAATFSERTVSYTNWCSATHSKAFTDAKLTSNPDGDSLTNIQEFAFGTDPTTSAMNPISYVSGGNVTKTGVPIVKNFAPNGEAPKYTAVFGRRKDHVAAGLTYTAEFSADLSLWTSSEINLTVISGAGSSGDIEAVSIPYPTTVPVAGGGPEQAPKFFRVGVK